MCRRGAVHVRGNPNTGDASLIQVRSMLSAFEVGIGELGKISTADDERVYFAWTGNAVTAMAFRCI
jgi:hypothetical protein